MDFTNKIIGETIMSHMYSIARQLQAPGIRTVATFNPTRLTKTLRNMARKSIATGRHIGGWSSKAKDVRELVFKLAGERPILYVQQETEYMTLHTPRPISEDTLSEIRGMLEADCTLQKMGYDDLPERRYRPTRDEFYKTIDRRHLENVEKLKVAGNPLVRVGSHYMIVRQAQLKTQIADVFLKERTVEEIAIAERIARLLDRDEEFPIPTTHNF
jgi:hypothetical protein